MKILVIISRDLEKGSTKYRVAQYQEIMKKNDIKLEFINRKLIDKNFIRNMGTYDVLFNQKCLFRNTIAKHLIKKFKKVVFDFDDAIYTRPQKQYTFFTFLRVRNRLLFWLKNAHVVTTANSFLAEYAKKYTNRVTIIPMSLDLKIWIPASRTSPLKIGWAGAPTNIPRLETINNDLAIIKRKYPQIHIAIFSGKKPALSFPFEYIPYKSGKEADFVKKLDIGLLPLIYDEYSKGKSPIKAIQYLACEVPVIANITGATREILHADNSIEVQHQNEWISALETLIENKSLRVQLGKNGRKFVEKHHDIEKVSQDLIHILRSELF